MNDQNPLKLFEITWPDYYKEWPYDLKKTFIAKSSSSARYQFWQYLDTGWPYSDYLNTKWKIKTLETLSPEPLFGDKDRFVNMRTKRGIEFAQLGMKVKVDGKLGIIVGSNRSLNLDLLFDNKTHFENCHPWWRITYYNQENEIIKEFKD